MEPYYTGQRMLAITNDTLMSSSAPRPFVTKPRYGKRALRLLALRFLKGQPWMHPPYRLLRLKRMWFGGHIDWRAILQRTPLPLSKKVQRVLIATSTGAHLAASRMEQTLGVALHLRDADVAFLLCDGAIPACMMCEYTMMRNVGAFLAQGPTSLLCNTCFAPAKAALQPLGLPTHAYSDWISSEEHHQIETAVQSIPTGALATFQYHGITLGEHALAATCRFYGTSDITTMEGGERVLRRYLLAAWLSLHACERLLDHMQPDIIVLHHGIYVPQGIIADIAKQRGIRLVTWHPAYRRGTFIFSHDDTYHRTMITEPTDSWNTMPWDTAREEKIMHYLTSRHTGSADWIWFHEDPLFERETIARTLALDLNKPIIGLLTNVVWDAFLHYPNNAYPTMTDWLYDTIDHFILRTDVQLVIRVHPAEVYGNVASMQTAIDTIAKRYSTLPPHIKIIHPLSDISTYSVMALCDSVLIYSTKTGIELAAAGMPIIVAGEAWVRGKGFTIDANNPDHYRRILAGLPLKQRLSHAETILARRYAYHFFYRRMIDVDIFTPTGKQPPYALNITSVAAIAPGQCPGLDIICDGILNGTPFVQG